MKILLFFIKIFGLLILLNFKGFAFGADSGMVYFPAAWAIGGQTSVNPAQLSNSTLIFKNSSSNMQFAVPFDTNNTLENNGRKDVVFLSKKVMSLPAGIYDTITFSTARESQTLSFDYKINFNVVANQMTPLGGVFIRSDVNSANPNMTSSKVVFLNKYSLNYNDFIDTAANSSSKTNINFTNASSPQFVQEIQVQTQRQNKRSTKTARYGFIVDTPCDFNGFAQINLSYNNNPVHFIYSVKVNPKSCGEYNARHSNPVTLDLQIGNWKIESFSEIESSDSNALGFESINNKLLLNYYKTDSSKFLRNNAYYAMSANKNFTFNITPDIISRPFLFAGTFRIQTDTIKHSSTNIQFGRDFSLRDLHKTFGEKQIYNGYSGERIIHDHILGTITILLRDVNVSKDSQSQIKNFQTSAIEDISKCIEAANLKDPLLDVNGNVLLRSASTQNSKVVADLKFIENSESVQLLKTCLTQTFINANLPSVSSPFVVEAQIYSL